MEKLNGKNNLTEITYIIAQYNVECIELEEFVSRLRSQVFEYIEKRKQESEEWEQASERDREDLIREFQKDALESLFTRPPNDRVLETLVFKAPQSVTVDDELLELFSGNIELYRFYVSNLGRASKVVQVPADSYYRKAWESLVELGLAKRGKDIPVKALLESLRLKDINEYFADRLDKKLTRKAQAIEFAAAQPDVWEVLSKHISFREMFQIVEPPGIDVTAIKECYEYAFAQAKLIRDTYVAGYRTLEWLQEAETNAYSGWEIQAENCCRFCSALNGERTQRILSKLPPFHIGCRCSIRPIYE